MLNFIQSLPFSVLATIVAVISAAVAALFARIQSRALAWFAALAAPFVLSCALYWSPVWFGANPSEFVAWAPLFVVPWCLCGCIASCVVLLIARRHIARSHG
jgi:hypothetical protein